MACNCPIMHQDIIDDVSKNMLNNKTIMNMALFFKIFGDPTRLKIINALINSKMCVCDIAYLLSMSHSAISHQLMFLKEYKIVKYTKIGKIVYYELNDEHIKEIFDKGCEHINE